METLVKSGLLSIMNLEVRWIQEVSLQGFIGVGKGVIANICELWLQMNEQNMHE